MAWLLVVVGYVVAAGAAVMPLLGLADAATLLMLGHTLTGVPWRADQVHVALMLAVNAAIVAGLTYGFSRLMRELTTGRE